VAGSHLHALYRHTESPLHRLRPEVKLAATFLFVVAVVATPREAFWAFGVHAVVIVALLVAGRIPPGFLARRLLVALPFVLFAVFLPLVGRGERVDVLWLSLSREGLWAAWNIFAKALLGASASVVMAATTRVPDVLLGLTRLRAPRIVVSIMGFMVRYLDVVIGELGRMRVALRSRGYAPRGVREAGALGSTLGTLFVRSYERGERVYLAMLARGFTGAMPVIDDAAAPAVQWLGAGVLAAAVITVASLGWVLR
jgi:cobalt/nickel transport system permease protein